MKMCGQIIGAGTVHTALALEKGNRTLIIKRIFEKLRLP